MKVKMYIKVFFLLLAVSLMPFVLSKTRKYSRNQVNILSRARCDLTCYETEKEKQDNKLKIHRCRSQCRTQEVKPGTCPKNDTPKWAAACVEACNSDSQCDGTQRCCYHGCGSTCSEPVDLETLSGLPGIPVMNEIKERRRGRVQIRWSDGVGDAARAVPGKVLYVLEEQHHLGPKYEEVRLGEWNLLLRTNKTKVSLRDALKPGRWYRFRVASVSATGSRGFSKPSHPFTPRRGPRPPPKPKKLKVRQLRMDNGTVTIRLEWKEPVSDLPIMKYKVYWSRRAKGVGGDLDSVLVNHQSVPKNQNFIDIKELYPNSMYFLQVQTISQFGLVKLRSDKAEVFYNTTSQMIIDASKAEMLQRKELKIRGLKLHKIVWYDHKLKARISWEPLPKVHEMTRYFVHWLTLKCHNPSKPQKHFAATTEQTTFELYELEYHCSYAVHVNHLQNPKAPESELLIKVPGCDFFKRKVNTTAINCEDQ